MTEAMLITIQTVCTRQLMANQRASADLYLAGDAKLCVFGKKCPEK